MISFPGREEERFGQLDKIYGAINKKFGTATIQRGTNLQAGKKQEAQMEQIDMIPILT